MNRFLGTKTKILSSIYNVLIELDILNGKICDIFSGSLAVSLFLKRKGYNLISNDINSLSMAYSKAFLLPNTIPEYEVSKFLPDITNTQFNRYKEYAHIIIQNQKDIFTKENIYNEFRSWNDYVNNIESLAVILAFLEQSTINSSKNVELRSDIFDYYSKLGKHSFYKSVRGKEGNRNYFTSTNAKRIDFILSHIRHWNKNGLLNDHTKYSLISILLDSMERCVNIQGSYHDFPREKLEERALKDFTFFSLIILAYYIQKKNT